MHEAIRVAVLIEKDGRFLLGKEATPIIYGLWNWQQGKVEPGEDLEAAALREAQEETGYTVRLVRKLTVIENPFPGTRETHVYLGKVVGGELAFSSDEILDVQWYTKSQILTMKDELAGPWVLQVIATL